MHKYPLIWKGLAVGIILLFIGTAIIPSTAQDVEKPSLPTSRGNWLYVGGSGPGNYSKIIYALENASTNDTIFVYSGTYFESFSISKSIHLIGEDKYTTIIDAQGSPHVINFATDWITVSGFTLTNTRDWANDCGIYIKNAWETHTTHNTITNNIFTQHREIAITVYKSEYNIITGNIFMNNTDAIETGSYSYYNNISNNTITDGGIFLWGAPNYNVVSNNHVIRGGITVSLGAYNIIINNTIENGGNLKLMWDTQNNIVKNNVLISSNAIILEESINNTVQDNELINSRGISISGNTIDYWHTHTIENNSDNGKPILYYKNQDTITIPSNAAQVILANCKNCLIKNLNITNLKDGVQLGFSTENTICFNKIYNNSEIGILLQDSQSNNINNNTIEKNSRCGIAFQGYSHKNKIFYNDIIKNGDGIFDEGLSEANDIQNNQINDNSNHGVYIGGLGGALNIINKNSFKNNYGGIFLDFSYFNIISNNNFLNNSKYHASYKVDYQKAQTNRWIKNYYDRSHVIFPVLIRGSIKTRFHYYDYLSEEDVYIYRHGFQIDWFPALKPYDIGV